MQPWSGLILRNCEIIFLTTRINEDNIMEYAKDVEAFLKVRENAMCIYELMLTARYTTL